MLLDGLLVEGVDLRRLGHSSNRPYALGDHVELCDGAPGEEYPRPLAGESTGDRAAHLSSASVDHGVLTLEQHVHPPVRWLLGGLDPTPLRNRRARPGSLPLPGVRA